MAINDSESGFRSLLGQARGLGSSKDGAAHWLSFRLLTLAYLPLMLWFVVSILSLVGAEHSDVLEFLRQPTNAVLMLLTVGVTFHHTAHGLVEVFEDYLQAKLLKTLVIAATKGLCLAMAVACSFSILKIAFA
jgi:succinate dehydrogenase / fumarate reductase, membrane anchor subunit